MLDELLFFARDMFETSEETRESTVEVTSGATYA